MVEESLEAEMTSLRKQVRSLKVLLLVVPVVGLVIALAAGLTTGAVLLKRTRVTNTAVPGRMEKGLIPVDLSQKTYATGNLQFSKPFSRPPLVFVCEAGHPGLFLVCKTDAITESGFTWAIGGSPGGREYRTEIAWLAIESGE